MIEQFKTLSDLQDVIKDYEKILMRPIKTLSHPTIYRRKDVGNNEVLIKGVRIKDWLLSEDQNWVLPHDQMGLSFSSNYKNLKSVYKLKERHNPEKTINVYWILEKADIPHGLKFVADRDKAGHYFLTVTENMLLFTLIQKLKLIALRMSVIRNAGKTL